jgi:hypothetical protein
VAEQLLASQEGLGFVKLVSSIVTDLSDVVYVHMPCYTEAA